MAGFPERLEDWIAFVAIVIVFGAIGIAYTRGREQARDRAAVAEDERLRSGAEPGEGRWPTEEAADAEATRRNLRGDLPEDNYWIGVELPSGDWTVVLRTPRRPRV